MVLASPNRFFFCKPPITTHAAVKAQLDSLMLPALVSSRQVALPWKAQGFPGSTGSRPVHQMNTK